MERRRCKGRDKRPGLRGSGEAGDLVRAGRQGGAEDHHAKADEAEDHHGGAEDHQAGEDEAEDHHGRKPLVRKGQSRRQPERDVRPPEWTLAVDLT